MRQEYVNKLGMRIHFKLGERTLGNIGSWRVEPTTSSDDAQLPKLVRSREYP
jgi:hypothetical protein